MTVLIRSRLRSRKRLCIRRDPDPDVANAVDVVTGDVAWDHGAAGVFTLYFRLVRFPYVLSVNKRISFALGCERSMING